MLLHSVSPAAGEGAAIAQRRSQQNNRKLRGPAAGRPPMKVVEEDEDAPPSRRTDSTTSCGTSSQAQTPTSKVLLRAARPRCVFGPGSKRACRHDLRLAQGLAVP